jgi:prevent-host-death family protein
MYHVAAMQVGVRELKARLSELLDRVAGGETITITERGKPKAMLSPIPGKARLDQAAAEGWVAPAARRGLRPVQRQPASRRVLEVIAEDRAR